MKIYGIELEDMTEEEIQSYRIYYKASEIADRPGQGCAEQSKVELEWMLDFLTKHDVRSIMTIGVMHGGVEYMIAKRYSELGKRCFILGCDMNFQPELKVTNAIIRRQFPEQTVMFLRYDTTRPPNYLLPGLFDFVFVDADHSYEGVKRDFELACLHTKKYVGFHDIDQALAHPTAAPIEVKKFWHEMKEQYATGECIERHENYGIGILSLDSEKYPI